MREVCGVDVQADQSSSRIAAKNIATVGALTRCLSSNSQLSEIIAMKKIDTRTIQGLSDGNGEVLSISERFCINRAISALQS